MAKIVNVCYRAKPRFRHRSNMGHMQFAGTNTDNDRMLAVVESLVEKGEDALTPEEDALLELLTGLIHDFESRAYPIPRSTPHEIAAYLLEKRGLQPSDLWPVLGSKSRVSEILSGKRSISKDQAKKLAEFFRAGVELFI
jgi:HTH-type transcriptional regulator / antitoxin HigA